MIYVSVPCSHGHSRLSIDEAETLLNNLAVNVESANRRMQGGLQLTDGQYLSRRDLYDYIRQFVPDAAVRNRAGKLFGALVRTSIPFYRHRYASPPLLVLCGACKLPMEASGDVCKVSSRGGGHRYYQNDREYLIDTASLIEYEDRFLPGGNRQLDGKKLEDFIKLMKSIRGE